MRDHPILQRIFTFGTMPSLIVPNFHPIIGIHPIPSFHAYHESVRVSGYMSVFEKSIHPAVSDHAYHEKDHGSRGLSLSAGTISVLLSPTHQIISIQRYPVRVFPTTIAPEYPGSVGSCQNFISPVFPFSFVESH